MFKQNSPNGKTFASVLHAGLARTRVANHLHGVEGGHKVLYGQIFFGDENGVFEGKTAFDGSLPKESVEEHEKEGGCVVADNDDESAGQYEKQHTDYMERTDEHYLTPRS